MAAKYNDMGMNSLFKDISSAFELGDNEEIDSLLCEKEPTNKQAVIPAGQINYLRTISETVKEYNEQTKNLKHIIADYDACEASLKMVKTEAAKKELVAIMEELKEKLGPEVFSQIDQFDKTISQLDEGKFSYKVRDKEFKVDTKFTSLSMQNISRVGYPHFSNRADKIEFIRRENLPGYFPFASGIFPFKRKDEDPKRMFAGEGGPKKTNKRFHYLSADDPAKRLSTAFDSVTLYGEDPDYRPDIYGKIGEAGVSIATLRDMEDLFEGFNLSDPSTSVSMTIN